MLSCTTRIMPRISDDDLKYSYINTPCSEDRESPIVYKGQCALNKVVYYYYKTGSTKTWNPESGNGNGITETEYGIRERKFQAIDLKKNVSNDNKITQQIKKMT